MTYRDLSPEDAHAEIQANKELRILDVRTEPEYAMYHLAGAQLVPVQELAMRVDELDADASWAVYCEHGMRSAAACDFLSQHGFKDIFNISGGMAAWVGNDLPFERP